MFTFLRSLAAARAKAGADSAAASIRADLRASRLDLDAAQSRLGSEALRLLALRIKLLVILCERTEAGLRQIEAAAPQQSDGVEGDDAALALHVPVRVAARLVAAGLRQRQAQESGRNPFAPTEAQRALDALEVHVRSFMARQSVTAWPVGYGHEAMFERYRLAETRRLTRNDAAALEAYGRRLPQDRAAPAAPQAGRGDDAPS